MQTGWAPPSKEKPVVLANSKNSVLSGHLRDAPSNAGPQRAQISHYGESYLRDSGPEGTVMLKTGTATLGRSTRNCGFTTLPLRGWVWGSLLKLEVAIKKTVITFHTFQLKVWSHVMKFSLSPIFGTIIFIFWCKWVCHSYSLINGQKLRGSVHSHTKYYW